MHRARHGRSTRRIFAVGWLFWGAAIAAGAATANRVVDPDVRILSILTVLLLALTRFLSLVAVAEVAGAMRKAATAGVDFYLLLLLAAAIASFGLVLGSLPLMRRGAASTLEGSTGAIAAIDATLRVPGGELLHEEVTLRARVEVVELVESGAPEQPPREPPAQPPVP